MPKASVIIPAYNAAEYIGATIDSILAQTFSDFECLVIDDGSTDHTVAVVKEYKDPRIKLFCQPNSGGPAKPRNVGLRESTGEYIFMFDSDDLMRFDKLEICIDALDDNPTADILFTNFTSIDEKGGTIKEDFLREYDSLWSVCGDQALKGPVFILQANDIYSALIKTNFIGTSSVALRKSAIDENDRFGEEFKNSDDRLFWILFTQKHNAIFIDDQLHQYRIRTNSISNQGFLRRGPSKIRALQVAEKHCTDANLKEVLLRQIVNDYLSLAYAYRKHGDYENQRRFAMKAMKLRSSMRALKLLMQSVLKI